MVESIVVESEDVRVEKSFDTDEFPVPTVTFDIESERDDAVEFRLVDSIPEDFAMEQVGFHPDYGSDNWTANPDQTVAFERELDAGESLRTVYGVRLDDDGEGERFMGEPEIHVAGPEADESEQDVVEAAAGESATAGDDLESAAEEVAPSERTDVVRDVIEGERETVPGAEDGDDVAAGADEADEGVLGPEVNEEPAEEDNAESADAGVSTGTGQAGDSAVEAQASDDEATVTAGATDDDSGGNADDDSIADVATGGVAEALAAEIRDGDVDEDDLAVLREELGVGTEGDLPHSTEAELDHLQGRVGELEAYTDALEAFIDEEGTAQEVLARVEDSLVTVRDRVGDVEDDLAAAEREREDLRDEIPDLSNLDALDDIEDDLADLEASLSELADDVEDVEDELAGVADVTERIDDVAESVEDIEDELDELQDWREQISSAFGGA